MPVIPRAAAFSFIIATNASSLPATVSASTIAQSLAELTAVALIISDRAISSPGSSQICVPPIEAAYSEQVTIWSSDSVPASRASKVSSRVMILVIEAGGICWSALSSYRTLPALSVKIQLFAGISSCTVLDGASSASAVPQQSQMAEKRDTQAAHSPFFCRVLIISDAAFPSYFTVTIICGRGLRYSHSVRLIHIQAVLAGMLESFVDLTDFSFYRQVQREPDHQINCQKYAKIG